MLSTPETRRENWCGARELRFKVIWHRNAVATRSYRRIQGNAGLINFGKGAELELAAKDLMKSLPALLKHVEGKEESRATALLSSDSTIVYQSTTCGMCCPPVMSCKMLLASENTKPQGQWE